jgi:hypothetical protein
MSRFLEAILKAHVGLENWRKVERLEARVSLTGGLYQLKGIPEGVPNVTMSVDTRRPALTITGHHARELPGIRPRVDYQTKERALELDSMSAAFAPRRIASTPYSERTRS